jgi:hypothetical protein
MAHSVQKERIMSHPAFSVDRYLVRRKVLRLIGAGFHFYDANGGLLAFAEMKGFKLKEDLRLFADEGKSRELLSIQARQILDISASYDVTDSTTGEKVGVLQRKGLKSVLKDEWVVKDAMEREIGIIAEDSLLKAIIRRTLFKMLPQSYDVRVGGQAVGSLHQGWNPFVFKLTADWSADGARRFDRRLGLAAAILLSAIEGRQQ